MNRAALILAITACAGWSECTSCTVPNPNYRPRDASNDSQTAGYQYVINKIVIPTTTDVTKVGLDLNNDGTVDNSLGTMLAVLSNNGMDSQITIDKGTLLGNSIMLADIQTSNFVNEESASIRFFSGTNAQPTPCSGAADLVRCTPTKPTICSGCGHHLVNGTFSVEPTSANHPPISGKITGGTFVGGPGTMTLLLSLSGSAPTRFELIGAKVQASGISEANIGGVSGANVIDGLVLAGGVTQEAMDSTIFPSILAQINAMIVNDCQTSAGPPNCGCVNGSNALTILDTFDIVQDCAISLAELKGSTVASNRQDVTIDGKLSYSIGVKATAVRATF